MATVIGMTAARGEEIANEHIDTATIEASDLVLTRRNAEEVRVTLPGGGGGDPVFLGAASFDGSHMDYNTSYGNGTLMTVKRWVQWDTHSGGPLGVTDNTNYPEVVVQDIDTADSNLSIVTAGWYMVNLHAFIKFPNSTPTHVRCIFDEWGPWMGRSYSSVHPVVPGGSYFETVPNTTIDVMSAPFWADAGDAVRPQLWWNTADATPQGNYIQLGTPNISIPALNFTFYQLSKEAA